MKFTQIPATAFKNLQLNAGIIVDDFDPSTLETGNILGATTGGVQFQDNVTFSDFADDIDNAPRNMMEFKKLDSHEVTMSGTFVSADADTLGFLIGAGDVEEGKIIPRNDVLTRDFKTIWWIGDYSDANSGASAGYIAIKLMNALNTGGFQIQSTDRGKGQFAFTFMGHYSNAAQDVVPYEIYIREGSASVIPSILLNAHRVEVEEGGNYRLTASVTPATATVTWTSGSSAVATVANGLVTAVAEGNTIITAAITVDGETVNDTCTVVVTAAEGE